MPKHRKRILNLRVVVSNERNESRRKMLLKYLSPGFELDFGNVRYGGIDSIEGRYYIAVTIPYIVDEILRAERDGYDAVIPNCFADPGVLEGRELVNIPVIGPAESSFHIAYMLGSRISVITIGGTYRTTRHGAMIHLVRQEAKAYDVSDRLVSVRTIGCPVEETVHAEVVLDALEKESNKALEDDGAEVIILGCTGMTGYAEALQKRLDLPIVDPSVAALKVAEMMITMNIKHSRLTTPSPKDVGALCKMKYPATLMGYSPE
jgi:allantoin racemase